MSVYAQYPTYQMFLAAVIAGALTIIMLPSFIKFLKKDHIGQQIRADGPQGHMVKQGTPTMGGIVMLVALLITILIMARPTPSLVSVALATFLTGALGLIDDSTKVVNKRSLGLSPRAKLVGQTVISVAFCLLAVNWVGVPATVTIPIANVSVDLGILTTTVSLGGTTIAIPWLYIVFVFLLMAGMSNAVNLTDGLDGLAGGTVMISMAFMAAVSFVTGDVNTGVFSAAIAGTCIGFLWFNCYPADIFMGDTGSLALGAALAGVAVTTKTELFSIIIGGLFVTEALSVLIQVFHFKRTHKRVFLMTPIHHHFEKKGWQETKVVTRFWIVSGIFSMCGFALFFMQAL